MTPAQRNGISETAMMRRGSAVARVLFVTGLLEDDSQGHHIHRLARELRRRGKEVGLLCGGGPLVRSFDGIGMNPIVVPLLRNPRGLKALPESTARWMCEFQPDLVHLFGVELQRLAPAVAQSTRRPYVLTLTSLQGQRRARVRGDWSVGSVLAASEKLREQLVNKGRLPKDVIGVLPMGISLGDYERYRESHQAERVPVVGTVGPLTEDSGVHDFIRAAQAVVEGGHEARFLVAGVGPERGRVRKLVRGTPLDRWLTLVEDFSDYRRMLGVLDICVVPAVHKGVGLDVIEAMACGKAVISTGGDTVYGIIRDGETGYLVPRDDPDAIAQRIIDLIENPDRRRAMVEAADEVVRERYSLQASVDTLLRFYGRCIERTEKA